MPLLRRAGAPLILALIVTGFYWKLLTHQYTWMDHPDMAYQVLPWFQFQAAAWHRGEFPLWDPHVWSGQPLLAQLQPGAAYPLNWPLFLLPLRDGQINTYFVQLNFVFTHILAALFCYLLCRDLGRSRAASVLGGVAFSVSGVTGWLGWPQFLNGAIWMPLVVLFFLRYRRGQRRITNAALSGTFLGISFLSGHHQIPMFTGLALAGLWIAEGFRRRLEAIRPAAGFVLFAGLTSAFQVLPGLELGARSIRWVGSQGAVSWNERVPYSVHSQLSMAPSHILGLALPGVAAEGETVGAAVVALALIGLAAGFKMAEVRALSAVALGGLLFALGGNAVFHGLAYLLVPMVEKARYPAMAIAVSQFVLAVLASYGVDRLRQGILGRWWIPAFTAFGSLSLAVVGLVAPIRPQVSREYERAVVFGAVMLGLAAILYAWRARHVSERAATALLVVVLLFELGTIAGQDYRHRNAPVGHLAQLGKHADVIEFVRHQPDFVRLELDGDLIPYNIGDWYGIDVHQAYLAGITTNVGRLEGHAAAPRIFAWSHFAGRGPRRGNQQLVFESASGVNVYRNAGALPRVWTVHEAVQMAPEQVHGALSNADLRRQAILTDVPPLLEACAGEDRVRVIERSSGHVAIEAQMSCRGLVVLSETYDPSWRAAVDGRPVRVLETNGAIRGVVVGGGGHRVDFQYRPGSVYLGAMLMVAGLLGAAVLALRSGR